jgi:hypothetical protein
MKLKEVKPPVWASKLVVEVCAEEGVRPPRVTWMRRPTQGHSTGEANSSWLRVVAGNNRKEVREVLLHELTHSVLGHYGRSKGGRTRYGHGAEFYAAFFAIAKRHGIGAQYIKQHESWYRPRGLKAGYRLYLRRARGEA